MRGPDLQHSLQRDCKNINHLPFNPITAGAAYILVYIFYYHIKYPILNMLNIKCDTNQQYLKRVNLHFVKSE